jgi:anti-sigma factor RsiW
MKEESLDPRIDRMMAALYGELSDSEARAFHRLLETDEALRAEWEELRGARRAIAGWEVKERVPRFVLLEDAVPRRTRAAKPGGGGLARWLEPFRALRGSWGFALVAAAAAGVAFLAAEARFERRLEARLGTESRDLVQSAPSGSVLDQRQDVPIEDLLARPGGGTDASPVLPATGTYVTRAELEASRDEMLQSLAVLLNQYDQREDQETLDLLQAMYERVNRQQLYDFRQLAGRVDNLGRELIVNRSVAEQKIEELLGPEQSREGGTQEAPVTEEK